MAKRLIKKIVIEGKIKTITGLHIGSNNTALEIGGVDSTILKNPLDDKPYIPGSSLKGKIRSLLEQSKGFLGPPQGKQVKFGPSKTGIIAEAFGRTDTSLINIPSRIIFRDCELKDDDDKILKNRNTDLPYTETKTEIVLDRITASATPRQLERVPAGVEFDLSVVVNIFEGDDEFKELGEQDLMKLLYAGMGLLQDDYLGGSGTRGSGRIKFLIENVWERDVEKFYWKEDAKDVPYEGFTLPKSLDAKFAK